MAVCDSCRTREAESFVTVRLDVLRGTSRAVKIVQFWLCGTCEKDNQVVMARDGLERQRLALRLTVDPEVMSRWKARLDFRNPA